MEVQGGTKSERGRKPRQLGPDYKHRSSLFTRTTTVAAAAAAVVTEMASLARTSGDENGDGTPPVVFEELTEVEKAFEDVDIWLSKFLEY